ncbi:MAG: response regulator [candidate division Zixibacteria bacterium]|nr:response regulator [candidate division Zixibacteria bacterium]
MIANDVNIFSSTSGLNITLEVICHKAKLMLNSDWTTCFAPHSKSGKMRALVNWGLSQESFSEFQITCANFGLKKFVREEELEKAIIINPANDNASKIIEHINNATPVERIVVCPCTMYGQLFGYLVWGYGSSRSIPKNYEDMAEPFGDQVALALKYNQLDKMTRRQNARLAALLDLSTTIYSSLNYREVLAKVAVYSKDLVGADSCSIYILKRYDGELEPLVVKDQRYVEQLQNYIIKPGEGITGQVVSEAKGKIVNREDEDSEEFKIPGITSYASSIISVPLIWSDEVLGAITLRKWKVGQFSKGDLDILTIFARQAADAIENARLFESLEKAYNELSAAQEQLIMSEKLRALGEMAGGVAHDFNNVLGIILGRAQLLQQLTKDEKVSNGLKAIENAAVEGSETVRRIQEFTRVSSQGSEAELNVNNIVQEAIEITKPKWKDEAQRKGIFIEVKADLSSEKPVLGSLPDLREVISNLILNSIDALPNGGRIELYTRDTEENLEIICRDNGVGMDEDTSKKVFFPFFTTKSSQGTGLGLAVAYGIITRHKGEITVSSELNKGSMFTIKLPYRVFTAKTEEETPAIEPVDRKAKILVIDDDENIVSILNEMLTYTGHTVTTAYGGQEGIDKFHKEPFDMVFTDLGMPEVTGWDVAQEVKSVDENMPVVLISGWGAQLEDDVLENSSIDFVVAKPFHLDKIVDLINRAFKLRESGERRSMPVRI